MSLWCTKVLGGPPGASETKTLGRLVESDLCEFLLLYQDSILISQQGCRRRHAGASWGLQSPTASIGWPSRNRAPRQQQAGGVSQSSEQEVSAITKPSPKSPLWTKTHNFSFNSSEWKLSVNNSIKAKTELASSHTWQHMPLPTCTAKQISNGKRMIFNFLFCLLVKKTFSKPCISSCKLPYCKDKYQSYVRC